MSYCFLRFDFFHRSSCSSPSVQYVLWIDCSRFRPAFAQEAPNYCLSAAWGILLSQSGCDDTLYKREVENSTPGYSAMFPGTLQTSSSQTVCQKLSSVQALFEVSLLSAGAVLGGRQQGPLPRGWTPLWPPCGRGSASHQ